MKELCQKIQDEQGFLIIEWKIKFPLGHVIKNSNAGGDIGRVRLPALRVVGYSTQRQWSAQHLKYQGNSGQPGEARFYHECVLQEAK